MKDDIRIPLMFYKLEKTVPAEFTYRGARLKFRVCMWKLKYPWRSELRCS